MARPRQTVLGPWDPRAPQRRTKRGLRPHEYDAVLAAQGGGCAICNTREPGTGGAFAIDHDHACRYCGGRVGCRMCVRGLLCSFCNSLLGMARDSVPTLEAAIRYLRERGPR